MSKPSSSKPRKQTAPQALVTALANQTRAMEDLTRTVKALVRENAKLVDVLLQDNGVIDDDAEPGTYMDGTRIS
jgi:hypothetical protein